MTFSDAMLHIWPQCRNCIMGMVQDSLSMAGVMDRTVTERIERFAENIFIEAYQHKWSSPVTANKILAELERLSGDADPYESFKKRELQQARDIYSQAEAHVRPGLRSRIALSVLGNSLDFFTDPDEVLKTLPAVMNRGISFYHDDVDRLEAFLFSRPERVLFFTDNSGEVFFDLPFYRSIRDFARQTVLVVKGGPALNDLSRVELENERLEQYFDAIEDTGAQGVGIDWNLVSQPFLELVRSADLIISKGMANFETVYPKPLSAHVFFLLKAKCSPIQEYLAAPPAAYCAIWKQGLGRLARSGFRQSDTRRT